jgi:hypothetical protein
MPERVAQAPAEEIVMTPEERQLLADLFDRIHAAGAAARDPQAEAFINDAVRALPFAPYVLAQTVLVQNQALEAASRRIAELQSTCQPAQPQAETSFLGNLGKSLFGAAPAAQPRSGYDASAYQRGAPAAAPQQQAAPPPQQYAAPQPQPYAAPSAGPWGAAPSGGGFLHNAMSTAAGVAGGIALGNLVGGLFGGHGGGLGGGLFGGGLMPGGGSVNNFYETGQGGANLQEMDRIQDQQQDALDDADAQQDAYQDASDNSDSGSSSDGGGQDT